MRANTCRGPMKRSTIREVEERRGETYHKSLVEVGAEQTLLPVVSHCSTHSFGHALLQREGDPCAVVKEFGVISLMVPGRRCEAAGRAAVDRHSPVAARRVHDDRFRRLRLKSYLSEGLGLR